MTSSDATAPRPARATSRGRILRRALRGGTLLLLVLLLGPLAALALGEIDLRSHWSTASHESTGQAPDPAVDPTALIQVYGARAFHWRGAFGIHTWIAAKRQGAPGYTVYQVIGWQLYPGGSSVSVREGAIPDARWYNARPALLAQKRGPDVNAMIDRLEAAVAAYPYADQYRAWPGPNSNTFIAHLGRALPELALDLPANALGKDYLGPGRFWDRLPSGTGWQVSLFGLLGLGAGLAEGIELNLLGLSAGLDFDRPGLRLPGWGRVGL